ncbi:AraC family transcriptional regulator [Parahaliea mediterranea]|uniref:AraC family transcriptional regulator n=1 Tax=Parahaliea mediterranea TaxID=651086 RepID=UPI000E2FEBE5|nr:AraC family transcriptional regulator [Parahaliea mediterranea]
MFSQPCISTLLRLLPAPTSSKAIAPGLTLVRADAPTQPQAILYQPVFYIVLQGQKQSLLAGEPYTYDPGRFLALTVPLPMEGHVTRASPAEPYLAIKIDVDSQAVADLLQALPELTPQLRASRGVCTCPVSDALRDCVERLVASLEDPQARRVLTPMLVREILFHGLRSPQGAQLAAFVTRDRHHQRIARVIHHIQQHYAEPMDVNALATVAHMSQSALHQHFKAVTRVSPLQYVKSIRLHRAHHLVAARQTSISEAAWQVGYQSVSQFSREYKRLFGQPPSQASALGGHTK